MASFTDTKGRTWELRATVESLRRVRSAVRDGGAAVDLVDLIDPSRPLLARVMDDPVLAADVAYALARPDAERAGVSPEDFRDAIDGPASLEVMVGIVDAMVSFARTPELRRALGSLPAAIRAAVTETERIRAATASDPTAMRETATRAAEAFASRSAPTSAGRSADAPE